MITSPPMAKAIRDAIAQGAATAEFRALMNKIEDQLMTDGPPAYGGVARTPGLTLVEAMDKAEMACTMFAEIDYVLVTPAFHEEGGQWVAFSWPKDTDREVLEGLIENYTHPVDGTYGPSASEFLIEDGPNEGLYVHMGIADDETGAWDYLAQSLVMGAERLEKDPPSQP